MKKFFVKVGQAFLGWGPWGAFALAILDSAGVPVPLGVDALVITIAAYSPVTGYFAAALAIVGSLIGSLILYYIGRKGGEKYLDRRTQRGWPLRFRQWFHRYGGITIFIPVLLPIPLPVKIFVLSAGAVKMNRAHFLVIVAVARIGRYFGLAYLGAQLGSHRPIQFLEAHAWELSAGAIALFVFLYLLVKWAERRHRELAR